MKFDHVQSIYFIGIGGAGVSGLARIAKQLGKRVMGSDATDSAVVQALRHEGIPVQVPQDATLMPFDYDLYIYSDAVQPTNAERAELIRRKLESRTMSYFRAVGEMMSVFQRRIAVSGPHGKI